jgi:HTH-type transcriptional regulator, transcriptional repressor of NAD biosynthesis genes
MKRGLVIGKFLPLHEGHIALIRNAAAQCDELIVSMSYTPSDPIDPARRFSWITETFKDQPAIHPFMIPDDFDNESLPLPERTKIWSDAMRKFYPPIDIVFSSEEYGAPFAKNLGAEHRSFDPERKQYPVSGTRIRQDPFRYWEFIPAIVRPYFVKKICLYGPESTGKSTLSKVLAKKYHTEYVPEVARELITSNTSLTVEDFIRIGYAQIERINEKVKHANKVLFCDTDAITTQIYSRHYLGVIPDILYTLEKQIPYDHYFLLDIDVPWIPDGLRDLGDRREEMFTTFKEALETRGISYTLIRGTPESRQQQIERWLHDNLELSI